MLDLCNTALLGLLYFPLMLISYYLLPESIAQENGPIENLQLVWLFLGFCYCYHYPKRLPVDSSEKKIWSAGALGFLLLFLREISWGFVFFYHANGCMYRLSEFPHLALAVHLAVGLVLLWNFILLLQGHFLSFLKSCKIPYAVILELILYAALARVAEKGLFLFWQGELGEELAELGCYIIIYLCVKETGDKRTEVSL